MWFRKIIRKFRTYVFPDIRELDVYFYDVGVYFSPKYCKKLNKRYGSITATGACDYSLRHW